MPGPASAAARADGRPMVAAGHPAVVDAATTVLARGGNAFDAVVAAGFAATVAEPCLTSLAGGGFCLVRTAEGEEVLVDFFVDTPGRGLADPPTPHFDEVVVRFEAADQPFHCGPGSIAVPGTLPGLVHVHERFGRLDRSAVVAPAAGLATRGVLLLPRQAGIIALLEAILLRTPEGRALFAPGGRLLGFGDDLVNPALAAFLVELGEGADLRFSGGELADALLSVTASDGLVTADDLSAYEVVERVPLSVGWRGRRVLTNPAPSFGGTLLAATLRRLADVDRPPGHPGWTAALVAASAEVDRDRRRILAGDDPLGARPPVGDTHPRSTRGTTHVSVWDGEGGAASMTMSNGECSGDVIPGTGILANNILGEDDLHPDGFHAAPPGLRVASMMSPTIVVGPSGATEVVVGSGGSKRIRSAVLQALLNVDVHGLDPRAAVEGPRVHWDVDHVEAEPGLRREVLGAVAALGLGPDGGPTPVNVWPERSVYFGGAHLVVPGRGAAGDPRRDGASAAL